MFAHWSEGSEPHIRLSNLGVQQWEEEFPENQTLKAIRIWLQGFNRTGETQTPLLEGTHKVVCASGPRGKEQGPHRRLNHTYLLVLEGLLQRQGVAVAHHGDKDTGSRSSGKHSLAWALLESAISPTKKPAASSAGLPQAKQPTGRELSPTHQQKSGIKFYWALHTRATPSSTHHQSFPSGSLHKPLREPHPLEGRQQKQEELQSCSLWNENHILRKRDKMKKQQTMYQMKEQDKTPEKQLNEVEIGKLPENKFRIMIVRMIQDLGKRMESKIEKM